MQSTSYYRHVVKKQEVQNSHFPTLKKIAVSLTAFSQSHRDLKNEFQWAVMKDGFFCTTFYH